MDLKEKKILVTGGNGFLGRFLVEELVAHGVPKENIFTPTSKERDFRKWEDCEKAVAGMNVVIHLAAVVGGIGANKAHPGKFFYDNALMSIQLMEASRLAGVEKFVSVGTVCSYPNVTPIPFKEEDLWNGYPEATNAPYGLAKKMLIVQGESYLKEYGFKAVHLIPVNLYGPRDNFNPASSHVIPSLIRKVDEAMTKGDTFIEAWGTGTPTREFLYVQDAAKGIIMATEKYESPSPVNLGSGMEISIKDLTETIAKHMGFTGEIRWDKTKPDGQPRRSMDVSKAEREFGFRAQTTFDEGLKNMIDWYKANHPA
jgi:GDP-L-fucose synthase